MVILWGYPQDFLWVWDGYGDRNTVPTEALVSSRWRLLRRSDQVTSAAVRHDDRYRLESCDLQPLNTLAES